MEYFTGHTFQVEHLQASLSWKDERYSLLQFHFHTPSEHTINGKKYPMEMHLVHKDARHQNKVISDFMSWWL